LADGRKQPVSTLISKQLAQDLWQETEYLIEKSIKNSDDINEEEEED